jgi:hypothetical protein
LAFKALVLVALALDAFCVKAPALNQDLDLRWTKPAEHAVMLT